MIALISSLTCLYLKFLYVHNLVNILHMYCFVLLLHVPKMCKIKIILSFKNVLVYQTMQCLSNYLAFTSYIKYVLSFVTCVVKVCDRLLYKFFSLNLFDCIKVFDIKALLN